MPSPLNPLEKLRGPLPQLKPADIVLVHRRGSLTRYLLRKITKSYWDHAAMVVYPKGEHNLKYNLICENVQGGIFSPFLRVTEIHRLDKYFYNPKKYDTGIKRVPSLSDEHRRRVRTLLVANLGTPYYKLNIFKFLLAYFSSRYRRWFLARQRWSCSALVQKAYYESAVTWQDRMKVIFKEGDWTPIEMQELTSPADIARSAKSEWIYNKR